jgi:hypothetical protein
VYLLFFVLFVTLRALHPNSWDRRLIWCLFGTHFAEQIILLCGEGSSTAEPATSNPMKSEAGSAKKTLIKMQAAALTISFNFDHFRKCFPQGPSKVRIAG